MKLDIFNTELEETVTFWVDKASMVIMTKAIK
jgi:hypothetical protein